jgi:hypothetical protein
LGRREVACGPWEEGEVDSRQLKVFGRKSTGRSACATGTPLPVFGEVLILKGFKCFVLKVRILKGLRVCFGEVHILRGLGAEARETRQRMRTREVRVSEWEWKAS